MAASQLSAENVAEGDSDIVLSGGIFSTSTFSNGSSFSGGTTDGFSAGVSLSAGVGQMPSCSYRSKKLELVGGAFRDMLVDRERGKSTAPDPLRLIGVDPTGESEVEEGRAGNGDEGALDEISMLNVEGVLGELADLKGNAERAGTYGGFGGRRGGDSVGILLNIGRARTGVLMGSSLTDRRFLGSITEATRLGNLPAGGSIGENSVLIGGALAGMTRSFSRMLARDFAFVSLGFGAKNCLRSLRLGEFLLRRGLVETKGLLGIDEGRLLEGELRDEAKGSAGREG